MTQSLRAFMREIIDYAGLFPPASLSLDPALHNYAQYRKSADAWMLSRFIIPAHRLPELESYQEELFADGEPFDFSVLGRATETVDTFREEIREAADHCARFHALHQGQISTEVLEVKLPTEAVLADDTSLVATLLSETELAVNRARTGLQHVFYEPGWSESWEKDIDTVVRAVSEHNESTGQNPDSSSYRYAGLKLRCGGVEASMFPSPEQLAYALNRAREYDVAVKCTAGLHHPVRHFNESVQTKMHGFLNVFGGAMLAYAHDLGDEELTQLLNEEDPEQFIFTDEAFAWGDMAVSTREIAELRETTLISYGSCSFDEPREDLRTLKLL